MGFLPVVLRSPSNSPTATEYPEDRAQISLSRRAKQGGAEGEEGGPSRDHPVQTMRCVYGKTEATERPRPAPDAQRIQGGQGEWELDGLRGKLREREGP